jgi:hypothetical protein
MELKYSNSGSPYIDLEEGAIIFSKITENKEKGFKYLVFQGRQVSSVCVSGAKVKNKRYTKIVEDVGFTVDMNFRRNLSGKSSGIPNDARFCFSRISEKVLKKIFDELVVDGYFPRKNLPQLGQMLRSYFKDDTDEWDDDPTADESYDDIGEEKEKKPVRKLTLAKRTTRKLALKKLKSKIKVKNEIK